MTHFSECFILLNENRNKHRCTQDEKLKLITLLCGSALILCIKILGTIFIAANVETVSDKVP